MSPQRHEVAFCVDFFSCTLYIDWYDCATYPPGRILLPEQASKTIFLQMVSDKQYFIGRKKTIPQTCHASS